MSIRLRLVLAIVGTALVLAPLLLWQATRLDREALEQRILTLATSTMDDWGLAECRDDPARFAGGMAWFESHDARHDREGRPRRPGPGRRRPPDWDMRRGPDDFEPDGGPDRPRRDDGRRPGPPRRPEPERLLGPTESRFDFRLWAYRADFSSANPDAPKIPAELIAAFDDDATLASMSYEVEGDERDHTMALVRGIWNEESCAYLLIKHSEPRQSDRNLERLRIVGAATLVLLIATLLACYPVVQRIRRLAVEVEKTSDTNYAGAIEIGGRDEISDLARAFNDAGRSIRKNLDDLAERERALRDFVANTTHDVMLPLTVLQGHLAEIEGALGAVDGRAKEAVEGSFVEVSYMASILQNLSTTAKLEGADPVIKARPVVLDDIVQRVVARNKTLARIKQVEIDSSLPDLPTTTLGDMTLLEQAIGNVVHNAVRFNDAGGHVAVILERDAPAKTFTIRVMDDGPGVSPEELELLCQRRFRSESARSRATDGLGIGLHIAKDVFDRHDMSLEFRSPADGGLEVLIGGAIADEAFED